MDRPNNRRSADYDFLLRILESEESLPARLDAAAGVASLIALDAPYPADLPARLDQIYGAAGDVRLATRLLKARNSLRFREKGIEYTDPGGLCSDRQTGLDAAIARLREAYDRAGADDGAFEARYRVDALISEGGMGRVFKAFRRPDETPVAIKFLADHFVGQEKIRKRFEREHRLLQALDHPNIVRVHDFGATDRQCFIVMEYVAGGNLEKLVSDDPPGPALLLPLFRTLCACLAAIHAKGIIHRDLKPSNILIEKDSASVIPKLADFGLATDPAEAGLTRTGMHMGTLNYSPPEQIENPHSVGPAGDIYSMGVTMYYALSGGRLPAGDYPALHDINPGVSKALNEVIETCMARRPNERWQDAGHLEKALVGAVPRTRHANGGNRGL